MPNAVDQTTAATQERHAVGESRRRRCGRASLRRKLLMLGLSLVIALLLGEVVVRVAKPEFPGFGIPQIEHRPAPGLGFEMVPDQRGYTFGEAVTVNSYGFRGPEISEPRGQQRILCLGDSITFGVGVADDSPYPAGWNDCFSRKHRDSLTR